MSECQYCHPPYKETLTEINDDHSYIRKTWVTPVIPLPAIDLTSGKVADTADHPFHELMIIREWEDEPWREEDGIVIQYCPWCGRKLDEEM